jgi:hypothetical protein
VQAAICNTDEDIAACIGVADPVTNGVQAAICNQLTQVARMAS